MVIHDLQCTKCDRIVLNEFMKSADRLPGCADCGAAMEICWSTSRRKQVVSVHPRERSVVWRHPKTGKLAYPGRNDVPMPERYAKAGYERHEMPHAHDVETFEKKHNVRNEKIHYNSGNGM